ncbi:MAG: cytochrome c oxidase assembly protein [Janthinobacterium lividum]
MSKQHSSSSHRRVLIILVSLVGFMGALAFASVPLYRIFCQKTGYGGTPRIALRASSEISQHQLNIRFNASVHRDLDWSFEPLQNQLSLHAGEVGLAFYRVRNNTDQPIVGIATYNVTPDKAGPYFNKIECFCFEEQTLQPHQSIDMAVQFFIDPDIEKDKQARDIQTITLSYTFFSAKHPQVNQYLGLPQP